MQGLKNLVGSFLGYGSCPVTGDTYWHTNLVSVPYSPNSGVIVSARALSELPKEEIAKAVFERSQGMPTRDLDRYSLEKIIELIPEDCMSLPRR